MRPSRFEPMSRRRALGLTAAAALALGGCVVAPYGYRRNDGGYPAEGGGGGGGGGEVIATLPPPAPVAEVWGVPPALGWLWIAGYWAWGAGRYRWTPGYWSAPRPGYRWEPHQWVPYGRGGWRLQGGRWGR